MRPLPRSDIRTGIYLLNPGFRALLNFIQTCHGKSPYTGQCAVRFATDNRGYFYFWDSTYTHWAFASGLPDHGSRFLRNEKEALDSLRASAAVWSERYWRYWRNANTLSAQEKYITSSIAAECTTHPHVVSIPLTHGITYHARRLHEFC